MGRYSLSALLARIASSAYASSNVYPHSRTPTAGAASQRTIQNKQSKCRSAQSITEWEGEMIERESHLLHSTEDVWLSIPVPVRANTKVDFPWVLVRLERLRDT